MKIQQSPMTTTAAPQPRPAPTPTPTLPQDRVELRPTPLTENLDKALAPDTRFGNLHTAFAQNGTTNCAAVGTTKAAMDTYGNRVFETQKNPDGNYLIKTKDGFTTSISPQELERAEEALKLSGEPSPEKSYATLCYAVMAKRREADQQPGCEDYSKALQNLSSSQSIESTAQALGLKHRIQRHTPNPDGSMPFVGEKGAVGWGPAPPNDAHIVYLDRSGDDCRTDHYGDPKPCDGTNTAGGKFGYVVTFAEEGTWSETFERWKRAIF